MSYQPLLDELQSYEDEYREYRELFQSDGEVDPTEQSQLDQIESLISVLRQSLGQQTSANGNGMCSAAATTGTGATGSSASSANMRVVPGAGGYEYEQHADGAIFIVKSPTDGTARTEVKKGTTGYNAILAEIGPFPSSGAPKPSLPTPPARSPNSGLPPATGGGGSPGYGDAPQNPPAEIPPGAVPANLEQLMAKEELTTDEVAEARRLIAQQPQDLQAALYEQLQEKVEYCNQRNNDCSQETSTGGTCNLTAVAMALQYLGVKNPYPQMDFDEALVKIATDENMGAITSADTWAKVAKKLGVNDVTVFASSVKQKRSWWESTVDNGYLKKGYGVVMSLDGHVVRLQAITEAGLVVDDPYGASKLSGRTFDDNGDGVGDRPKYSFTDSNDSSDKDGDAAANSGDDTGYPWADVEKYTFKYLVALK
jgi:hypothetical protein